MKISRALSALGCALLVAAGVVVACDMQARRFSHAYDASASALHAAQIRTRAANSEIAGREAAAKTVKTANTQLMQAADGLLTSGAADPISAAVTKLDRQLKTTRRAHEPSGVAAAPDNGWDFVGWAHAAVRNRHAAKSTSAELPPVREVAAKLTKQMDAVRLEWQRTAKTAPDLTSKLTAGARADLADAAHAAAVRLTHVDPLTPEGIAAWRAWSAAVTAANASADSAAHAAHGTQERK